MKLDRVQLSKMIHHVLSYDFDEQGELHFRRFTESQRDAYKAASSDWYIRTKASAGVTFDFVTNSAYIVLQMKLQTKIVALLPIYRNDGNHQTREIFREYSFEDARNILLETYAGYKNITVVKETKIPHIPEVFASDYLHPNELGFQYMAKAIIDVMKDEMELK